MGGYCWAMVTGTPTLELGVRTRNCYLQPGLPGELLRHLARSRDVAHSRGVVCGWMR